MQDLRTHKNDTALFVGIFVTLVLFVGGVIFAVNRLEANSDAAADVDAPVAEAPAPPADEPLSTYDRLMKEARGSYDAGDYPGTVGATERILDSSPLDAEARFLRGRALLALGRLEESIDDLKVAIESDPDEAEYHDALGQAYLAADQPESAVESLRRASELAPEDPEIRQNLEIALTKLERQPESRG